MAAEARAESPAPAAPPPPVPEKRAAPADVGEEEEERPGPKRRRAFVATLDGVPCAAAAAEEDGHRDGLSFSFQHSRGGFVPLETTPKFGSFNPPAPAEQQEALDPKPAPPAGEDSPVLEEEEDATSPRGVADSQDGDSEAVAAAGDQGEPETQDGPECADVHHP